MSIEFHVGRTDHHKVEDFLARDHDGVAAISLDAKTAAHQSNLADVARSEGVNVLLDPRTDRLEHAGLHLEQLPGYRDDGYDVERLASSIADRQELTERVLAAQDGLVSVVTPAYFFGRDERSAHLNLALAEAAQLSTDLPVRPIVALRSRTSVGLITELATEYTRAGFQQIDLRFSPLGGENDSIAKVRSVFAAAQAFTSNGITVTLGHSGNIGQVAYALGHVAAYSVGIGMGEKVDLASDYTRQATPPKRDENGKRIGGGQWEGVYLPGLAMTLKKTRAEALLGHSDIRTRIGRCRLGACAHSLTGPTTDHRTHYLHARAAEMAFLQNTPPAWRPEAEAKRLRRALELRELVNKEYKSRGEHQLSARTLASLVDGIHEIRDAAVA
ncbi:hypothetical protein [Microbacterium rhizomatis]|uniref:Uncharacterized protein n=1 Tax=Microbacterium rhizomatis TaxID=1631477 RepID=A0A5J5IYC6_9MICO|nr:hypothetical protein [Microbacterium rhizomatis]KAA9105986.1 hypothetical protein F6B43_16635 [Microbacterium rhizomatis]